MYNLTSMSPRQVPTMQPRYADFKLWFSSSETLIDCQHRLTCVFAPIRNVHCRQASLFPNVYTCWLSRAPPIQIINLVDVKCFFPGLFSYCKSIPSHALPISFHLPFTLFRRVIAGGKKHAFVPLALLVLAHAARLYRASELSYHDFWIAPSWVCVCEAKEGHTLTASAA